MTDGCFRCHNGLHAVTAVASACPTTSGTVSQSAVNLAATDSRPAASGGHDWDGTTVETASIMQTDQRWQIMPANNRAVAPLMLAGSSRSGRQKT